MGTGTEMVSRPSCHQPHEELLPRDVGGSANSRPFQLSTITSLHYQRLKEFAGGPEGSGGGVGNSKGKSGVEGSGGKVEDVGAEEKGGVTGMMITHPQVRTRGRRDHIRGRIRDCVRNRVRGE